MNGPFALGKQDRCVLWARCVVGQGGSEGAMKRPRGLLEDALFEPQKAGS